ncbi:glycosyltransferase family 4 protein [candidate division TA06 bacterium]|nr:glycosyltransferase family 4 protein [candidate division TA06 bacterium]
MRVLYISTAFQRVKGDVIAPWMTEAIKRLKKKGLDIEVFTSSYKGMGDHYIDGIYVRRFRYFQRKLERLAHEEAASDRFKRSLFYKFLAFFYLIGGMMGMLRLCRKERYDILHVHWPIPHGLFGYIGKKVSGAKMISTFYSAELTWIKKKIPYLKWFLKWVIHHSDAVTANSSYTAKELEELVHRHVSIIPYGAAIQEGELKIVGRQKSPHQKNILFVGRLIERKGVPYLIEAFEEVLQKKDVILTIVGEGPERKKLERMVRSKKLEERVFLPGIVKQEDLETCYQKCDVFVLPAVTDKRGETEGLGVVLIEAMNYKKPVIASNVGGIVDIIKDNETGILVPERDSKKLAEAISELLTNEEQARRLREEGYRFVNENFSWDRVTDRLLTLYHNLLYSPSNVEN